MRIRKMNRPELLAPAGNYEAFLGALNAGADAFYLAGQRFGARAYADNFSEEELCRALRTAHFHGKKIYLTVNTLVKEKELDTLYPYLLPLYEAGLDGVIVQDIGVMRYIGQAFPSMELHASTQMTLTGSCGAAFLKRLGVTRVVPARELSLEEIKALKQETGMEIECFVHGAMCYSYSGQCLFSSILGGRSGNRGRCAQPCRLPYSVWQGEKCVMKDAYPLSLKDMCTISYLPSLIEAGIDSFKIEGRMKKPEYAAGVTALYRKYIDLYEQDPQGYRVDQRDLEQLQKLYIRSEVQTGYYDRYNGREMVTIGKPGYLGSDESLLRQIREKYLCEPAAEPVTLRAVLRAGEPLQLSVQGREHSIEVYGACVQEAQKNPLTPDTVRKQLMKTGNSCLKVSHAEVILQGDCFLPVSALNAVRREAVDAYENAVIQGNGLPVNRKATSGMTIGQTDFLPEEHAGKEMPVIPPKGSRDILVHTLPQLTTALDCSCRRIYIESDLYLQQTKEVKALVQNRGEREIYLALPYILRKHDAAYLERLLLEVSGETAVQGMLLRNYEALGFLEQQEFRGSLVADAGLYCFNREALAFWKAYAEEICLPYELNAAECRQITAYADDCGITTSMIAYGTIPMMLTANCLRKTTIGCLKDRQGEKNGKLRLVDRRQMAFPVETNCIHCYNVIYNSLPYSLHTRQKELERAGADVLRYDFVWEDEKQMRAVLDDVFPFAEYTTGHVKRGIE